MREFAKYRKFYTVPERVSPEIARLNRITATLEKERTLADRYSLSPVTSEIVGNRRRLVEDALAERPKASSIEAALKTFTEKDFADPQKRLIYRQLRSRQIALSSMRSEARKKVPPSGADRRQFSFEKDFPHTVYGTAARVGGSAHRLFGRSWLPKFLNPTAVVPCIQRMVRREVMFANGRAGRAYHVKHRRNWASGVPC